MEKVLHTGSKSRKVKRRQAKEEEHLAKKELDRPKNETPKAKIKTHSKLKRTKDIEHGISAGEGSRSGEVTPKLSWAGRTSKAKRSKDSDDLDLQASIIVLDDTPKSGTNNLPRGISENEKSGDVDPTNITPKETPPVCHTPRGSSSGSEDEGSPTVFLCTQDEYVVGWDYGSPRPSVKPDYKSKRKGRRRKYKTKLFSPLQQNRRIIPKKAVSDDMSEAIRVFQEATKKIKSRELNAEGSTDETGAENSSWDSHGSTSVVNSQQEKVELSLLEEETVLNAKPSNNNNKVSNLKHSYEIDGEDLIILLDDDDDECMVQCSQQVENNLKAVGSSDGVRNADHKLNVPNSVLCKKSVKQKQENPFEKDAENIVKSSTNSNTGSIGIGEIRSKSVSNNTANKKPASTITSRREGDQCTKSVGNFKTESSNSNTEPVFDDSFDAILETFKDEDIELLSQGLEDKSGKNSKAEVPIDNSCNGQNNIISNSSGAQGFVLKESSTYNKDKKLFQSNGFVNYRMPCSDKNSAVASKKLPSVNQMGTLTKNCYNPKSQTEINSNRKEKPLSSKPPPQQSDLTILETICDSSENTSSSTQRCTPAEIERKRLEAMQRLEKKRKARALFGCANPVQLPKGPNR